MWMLAGHLCPLSVQVSINSRKADVEAELAVVAPVIEAARLAVGQIKSDHLNEIRSLKAPPDAIRDVLEGVLKLMGQADTSWNSMKKFLGNRGVKVTMSALRTCCKHVAGSTKSSLLIIGLPSPDLKYVYDMKLQHMLHFPCINSITLAGLSPRLAGKHDSLPCPMGRAS